MSRALLRFVRLSPTKARLVAREVQGMNAEIALASLEFTPNKAAKLIAKVIASAIANGGYDAKGVVVHSCRVDAGPVLRRFMPRARGRATPIRKPTSHILVEVLSQSEINALQTKKPSKKTVANASVGDKKSKKVEGKPADNNSSKKVVSSAAKPKSQAKNQKLKDK